MRVALAWHWKRAESSKVQRPDARAVGERLARQFGPLLANPPEVVAHAGRHGSFSAIELPTRGWRAPFHELDARDGAWAYATEYPLNAARLLGRRPKDGALLALERELARAPGVPMRELYPPFGLFASRGEGEGVAVTVDGLGQGQLFEYEDAEVWAVANKPAAFEALGVELRLDPEAWPVRFTLGWFPEDSSGYRNVRRVGPGQRFELGSNGVSRRQVDALGDWVNPPARSPEDCLELARESIEQYVSDLTQLAKRPSVGLSGGWDSRAIASVLRSQGADFELRVRGHPERFDVLVAWKLAQVAGLPIRVKTQGGFPPDDAEACRNCMRRALAWQSGNMATLKHKTFLARKPGLDGGVANVMGQHSGIGKADFAVRIEAHELEPEQYERALLDSLMRDAPPMFTAETAARVRAEIASAYRRADDHGLRGLHRLHYFFLHEFTRRWGSATVNAQTGVVLTPFLNPGFIRAAFAFPPERIPAKPFHRHVTGTHAPDWAEIVYESHATKRDLREGRLELTGIEPPREDDLPAWRRGRRYGKYHQHLYWQQVGAPLVEEALDAMEQGAALGAWFQRSRDLEAWCGPKGQPDALVLAHLVEGSVSSG